MYELSFSVPSLFLHCTRGNKQPKWYVDREGKNVELNGDATVSLEEAYSQGKSQYHTLYLALGSMCSTFSSSPSLFGLFFVNSNSSVVFLVVASKSAS